MHTSHKLHISHFFSSTLFKTCFTQNSSPQHSMACQEPQAPAVQNQQKAGLFKTESQMAGTDGPAACHATLASLLTAAVCLLPITIILCPGFCPTISTANQRESCVFFCTRYCCQAPALTVRLTLDREDRASEPRAAADGVRADSTAGRTTAPAAAMSVTTAERAFEGFKSLFLRQTRTSTRQRSRSRLDPHGEPSS